jgi:transposase
MQEYRFEVLWLKSVPGTSTLAAMILLTEFADLSRFSSLDKLVSYAGLVLEIRSKGKFILSSANRRGCVLFLWPDKEIHPPL